MTAVDVRAGVCTGDGPCDSTPFSTSTTDNWVARAGGLPLYIRAIAKALKRKGLGDSQAISTAVATVKHWSTGGGNVTAETRARAAEAVAEWEAKKGAAHGSRDAAGIITETGSSAATLLPVGPTAKQAAAIEARNAGPHAFTGRNLAECGRCGKPVADPIHTGRGLQAGVRASGAYSSGHPFYGNQWSNAVNSGATPAELAQLAQAIATAGSPGGGGLHAGSGGHHTAGGGGKGKSGAGAKKAAAKHQTALKNAAAKHQLVLQHQAAQRLAVLKRAATVAQTSAAKWRAAAAHAKTPTAKVAALGKAKAYQDAAVKLETALAKAEGHRHAGPEHQQVPTGHVAGNPTRARRAHKIAHQADADHLESRMRDVLLGVFAQQEKRTLGHFNGSRGRKLRKTITTGQRADSPPPGPQTPPPDAAAIFDTGWAADQTAQAVAPIYQLASKLAQQRITDQLGLPDGTVSSLGTALANVEGRVNQLAGQVTQTTFDQIQQAIAAGIGDGDSIAQIADRVRHVFDIARGRAELIARTETNIAVNQAAFDYAQASGSAASKEWLAVHDERTRMAHRVADGQTVPIGQPFAVGAVLMMHPGDPTAPPDEVCNCRCAVLYHPVPRGNAGGTIQIGDQAA